LVQRDEGEFNKKKKSLKKKVTGKGNKRQGQKSTATLPKKRGGGGRLGPKIRSHRNKGRPGDGGWACTKRTCKGEPKGAADGECVWGKKRSTKSPGNAGGKTGTKFWEQKKGGLQVAEEEKKLSE